MVPCNAEMMARQIKGRGRMVSYSQIVTSYGGSGFVAGKKLC